MKVLKTSIVALFYVLFCTVGGIAAHAACDPKLAGATIECPIFTEPAFTSVPSASMGGTGGSGSGSVVMLFNGIIPSNGFMVQILSTQALTVGCYVNDNGPANGSGTVGFAFGNIAGSGPSTHPPLFVTPLGYKPIGPVSIWCNGGALIESRGW